MIRLLLIPVLLPLALLALAAAVWSWHASPLGWKAFELFLVFGMVLRGFRC